MQASHYEVQELLDRQGAVSTYQALDTLSKRPVLYYQHLAEPIDNARYIYSENILNILNIQYTSGRTHVFTVQPTEKQPLKLRLDSSQLERCLVDTARALKAAHDAGVVHGDIRPKRIFFDTSRYLIEGYGVRWELLPSRYTPPEKYQSMSGDIYSWAKTMGAFVPFSIPDVIADLLTRCLSKKPENRPSPKAIIFELTTFFLELSKSSLPPVLVNLKQISTNTHNKIATNETELLTHTQERFVKALDILKQANI